MKFQAMPVFSLNLTAYENLDCDSFLTMLPCSSALYGIRSMANMCTLSSGFYWSPRLMIPPIFVAISTENAKF